MGVREQGEWVRGGIKRNIVFRDGRLEYERGEISTVIEMVGELYVH